MKAFDLRRICRAYCSISRLSIVVTILISYPAVGSDDVIRLLQYNQDYPLQPSTVQGYQSVAISPDGNDLYALSTLKNSLAHYRIDLETGLVQFVEALRDGLGGVEGLYQPASIVVSPDGQHVYVTGYHASSYRYLAYFSRSSSTGELAYAGSTDENIDHLGARSLAITSDGKHVYTTSITKDRAIVFARDHNTGHLSEVEQEMPLGKPIDLELSPAEDYVLTAQPGNHSIGFLSRNPLTGTLEMLLEVQEDPGIVDGLYSVTDVIASPDGKQAYSLNPDDGVLTQLSIDTELGSLQFDRAYKNSDFGYLEFGGLEYSFRFVLTPDGQHLFVLGNVPDMFVLRRNLGNGTLALHQTYTSNGNLGIAMAAGVMSPNGHYLYVAVSNGTSDDGGIAVFKVTDVLFRDSFEAN